MPVSKYASFVGFGKESTAGTAVAPTLFTPATSFKPEDVRNYVQDSGIRGSYVDTYDEIPTQGWATYEFGGNVYGDTIGAVLKGLLGDEVVTGAGPYVHAFSTLNSGQPPSFTVTEHNGFNTRQFPGAQFSSLELKFGADALLEHTTQASALPSATTTKPAQSFGTLQAITGNSGVVKLNSVTSSLVESGSVKIERKVDPILAVNGTSVPYRMWGAAVAITGSLVVVYEDDTFLTPMLNGTKQPLELTFTQAAVTLDITMTKCLFTKSTVERGKEWVEVNVSFEGVGNTTDAGGSGGYSPCKVTLTNAQSAAY